jgi:hypothetical protein
LQKLKFDARMGTTDSTSDFYNNPWKYSFVHNFKVHYKRGVLQALANKLDISITATTADLPSTQGVMNEFNERMKASIIVSNTRERYSPASYHVTQIEYKESFAFYDPQTTPRTMPKVQAQYSHSTAPPIGVMSQVSRPSFCRRCGASLSSDSAFCSQCGERII